MYPSGKYSKNGTENNFKKSRNLNSDSEDPSHSFKLQPLYMCQYRDAVLMLY